MSLKRLITMLITAAMAAGSSLYSQGKQYIPVTGTEEAVVIQPFWAGFTTIQTLSLPSLQMDELVLILEASSPGGILFPYEDVLGFKGYGTGKIYNEDGVHIGDFTFYYAGHSLDLPPVFDYVGQTELVGTIFAGPLEGLVLTETAMMEGTVIFTICGEDMIPTYPYYSAEIKGYLTVPGYVDFPALKSALKTE